jgi:hypothetical protein
MKGWTGFFAANAGFARAFRPADELADETAMKQLLRRRNHFGGFVQTSRNGSPVLIAPTTR